MKLRLRVLSNDRGVAAVEMALTLPILVVMLWAFVQLAQVYRAVAGMQQALGEGARYATLCLNPGAGGCSAPAPGTGSSPAAGTIKRKIMDSVAGTGFGTFTVSDPVSGSSGTAQYFDLSVTYSQPTDLLLIRVPTMRVGRSKRVWLATSA